MFSREKKEAGAKGGTERDAETNAESDDLQLGVKRWRYRGGFCRRRIR